MRHGRGVLNSLRPSPLLDIATRMLIARPVRIRIETAPSANKPHRPSPAGSQSPRRPLRVNVCGTRRSPPRLAGPASSLISTADVLSSTSWPCAWGQAPRGGTERRRPGRSTRQHAGDADLDLGREGRGCLRFTMGRRGGQQQGRRSPRRHPCPVGPPPRRCARSSSPPTCWRRPPG